MIPDGAVEAAAEWLPHSGDCEVRPERDCTCWHPRVIVHYCAGLGVDRYRDAEVDAQYRAAWWIAVQLAKVYKDHPDYRQEWAL